MISRPAKTSTNYWVDLVIGALAVAGPWLVWRGGRQARGTTGRKKPKSSSTSDRIERLVAKGVALAFVAGVITDIAPGVFPFIALKDIADLNESPAATLALIVGFYLVMFTFIEVPLLALLFAPPWAERTVGSFNRWLDRHGRAIASSALLLFGGLEIVHGLVTATR